MGCIAPQVEVCPAPACLLCTWLHSSTSPAQWEGKAAGEARSWRRPAPGSGGLVGLRGPGGSPASDTPWTGQPGWGQREIAQRPPWPPLSLVTDELSETQGAYSSVLVQRWPGREGTQLETKGLGPAAAAEPLGLRGPERLCPMTSVCAQGS